MNYYSGHKIEHKIEQKNGYNPSNCTIETKDTNTNLNTTRRFKRGRFGNINFNNVNSVNVYTETHFVTCYFCDAVVKVPITQSSVSHTNGRITHPGEVFR